MAREVSNGLETGGGSGGVDGEDVLAEEELSEGRDRSGSLVSASAEASEPIVQPGRRFRGAVVSVRCAGEQAAARLRGRGECAKKHGWAEIVNVTHTRSNSFADFDRIADEWKRRLRHLGGIVDDH